MPRLIMSKTFPLLNYIILLYKVTRHISVSLKHHLDQGFSTFLMLWFFNAFPYDVVTPYHKNLETAF